MEQSMKDIIVMVFVKAKEQLNSLQVRHMKVRGKTVKEMELVNRHGQMEESMKENIKMIK